MVSFTASMSVEQSTSDGEYKYEGEWKLIELTPTTGFFPPGYTPLHRAIIAEDFEEALRLTSERKYLDIQNDSGNTPLHLAVTCDVYTLYTALLDAGASRVISNYNGDTPLHVACREGNAQCAEVLLYQQVDNYMDVMNREGYRPVHLAVKEAHISVLAVLNDAGADMNAPDGSYSTPLRHAIMKLNLDMIRFLVEECNVDVSKYNYFTMLEGVFRNGLRSVKELLTPDSNADTASESGESTLNSIACSRELKKI
jgi:ankyrin repeat protein